MTRRIIEWGIIVLWRLARWQRDAPMESFMWRTLSEVGRVPERADWKSES